LNLLPNPQYLLPITLQNENRKDITLKATLDKSGYVPGEIIHIKLEIENPEKVCVQSIGLSLLQSFRIQQNTRGYNIFQTTLPNIKDFQDGEIKENYSIKIPSTTLPPTYQFQGGVQKFAVVNISYLLRFAVEVEGIFTNFNVDVPITLGTEPAPDLNKQESLNPMIVPYSAKPEHSMSSNHD
jgi:hypothetical protein